jgi:hypothetical protein
MIRLPDYDTESSAMPSNAGINETDSLVLGACDKVSSELGSGFRMYVPSTLDDYFADETTPILPKYDAPQHTTVTVGSQERAVPDEDAPEYESPDEDSPNFHGHL